MGPPAGTAWRLLPDYDRSLEPFTNELLTNVAERRHLAAARGRWLTSRLSLASKPNH
jgi:hypothetical protein